jgi:hypothetical protein
LTNRQCHKRVNLFVTDACFSLEKQVCGVNDYLLEQNWTVPMTEVKRLTSSLSYTHVSVRVNLFLKANPENALKIRLASPYHPPFSLHGTLERERDGRIHTSR